MSSSITYTLVADITIGDVCQYCSRVNLLCISRGKFDFINSEVETFFDVNGVRRFENIFDNDRVTVCSGSFLQNLQANLEEDNKQEFLIELTEIIKEVKCPEYDRIHSITKVKDCYLKFAEADLNQRNSSPNFSRT